MGHRKTITALEWNMWNVHGILCAYYVFKLRNSTCWLYLKNKSSHILYASQVQVSHLGRCMRGKSSTSTWLTSRVFEYIVTWTQLWQTRNCQSKMPDYTSFWRWWDKFTDIQALKNCWEGKLLLLWSKSYDHFPGRTGLNYEYGISLKTRLVEYDYHINEEDKSSFSKKSLCYSHHGSKIIGRAQLALPWWQAAYQWDRWVCL